MPLLLSRRAMLLAPVCLSPLLPSIGQAGPTRPALGARPRGCRLEIDEDAQRLPPWRKPWSLDFPETLWDLARARPLVSLVYVPLCSNDQIECGSAAVGDPARLETNLYWGGGYGAVQIFSRPKSHWEEISVRHPRQTDPQSPVLEERVYRREVPGRLWRTAFDAMRPTSGARGCLNSSAGKKPIEQIAILRAVHGDQIDEAVLRFFRGSTQGVRVTFPDHRGNSRTERAQIVGYAGHNRLMDGLQLPRDVDVSKRGSAQPSHKKTASFVLACYSENYFESSLRQAGSDPLVMTRALMAPEGYVIDAVLRALGDNSTKTMLRHRVVQAYATWQRIPLSRASLIFAR